VEDDKKNQEFITDEVVSKYLMGNPDFFERNESALSSLVIPHVRGRAISLVERQLLLLREKNNSLHEQLNKIVVNARDNELVGKKIHEITITILKERELEKIIQVVENHFQQAFDASYVRVVLFSKKEKIDGFFPRESSIYLSLEEFILKGEIKCGPISQPHFSSLFSDYEINNSAVMIPIKENEWSGAFIVCSSNPKKYFSGMQTDFLLRFVDFFKEMVNKHIFCS
jgi:uncharacterized protein